ncbi:hypothetical protein [Desulfatitalea alkaliphila]|uniref:Uncharacterized protein n=1 Tax=Desulfatitalea alkaliphila TaxID=2929485 RepID=A0AA41R6L8_9BACT|nr:hypothetical protein [Desulfatitalea alkaliphila]MCJ8502145.1 hypothetical protein [Desulfatitalea alkaliphila]
MKPGSDSIRLFEMDGEVYRLDGTLLTPVESVTAVAGDKWLVTDLREAASRLLTVEAPVRYAELLVRKKLQESGEFDEPVEIFTHWKKKRGRNSTDIFFTAVPTRQSRFYLEALREGDHSTLVFAMYGVLWDVLQRRRAREPVAVVLRHDRFAEMIVGHRNQVYYANRCVAFDTAPEQLQALWDNVRNDIASVEEDSGMSVARVILLHWLDAADMPDWPAEWRQRIEVHADQEWMVGDTAQRLSWPCAAAHQALRNSVSPPAEKTFYAARRWAPAVNGMLLLLLLALAGGWFILRDDARQLARHSDQLARRMAEVQLETLPTPSREAFTAQLDFLQSLDRGRRRPAYREVLDDLTASPFEGLRLNQLKLEYGSGVLRVALSGDVASPFESAHEQYRRYLRHLQQRGYRIEESRFDTRITVSQLMLKLRRPL